MDLGKQALNKKACQKAGFFEERGSLFFGKVLIFLLEALNSAFCIHNLLGPRKEGMAGRADIEMD